MTTMPPEPNWIKTNWKLLVGSAEAVIALSFWVGAVSAGGDMSIAIPLLLLGWLCGSAGFLTYAEWRWFKRIIGVVVTAVIFSGPFYFQRITHPGEVYSPLATETLPGFSITFALKILNVSALRRQYVFQYEDAEKSNVALYFSPNDIFVFSATDVGGETVSLEVPVGEKGIPIYKFIFLSCEIGVSSNTTDLRVLVDGKEVQHREYPYRADLGSRNWAKGVIGADLQGRNNSAFEIAGDIVGHVTLTNGKITMMI